MTFKQNNFSKEEINRYYQTLPEELKEFYDSSEGSDKIMDICDDYNLRIDQMGEIVKTTYYLILGMIKPGDFVPRIITLTSISEDIANLITHQINEQVIKPIRSQLMEHHNKLSNHSQLPTNVEPEEDLGFSSVPYQEKVEDDQEKTDLINEIENPSPITYVTKDTFSDKQERLVSSERINFTTDQKDQSQKNDTQVPKPKIDPYREPI